MVMTLLTGILASHGAYEDFPVAEPGAASTSARVNCLSFDRLVQHFARAGQAISIAVHVLPGFPNAREARARRGYQTLPAETRWRALVLRNVDQDRPVQFYEGINRVVNFE